MKAYEKYEAQILNPSCLHREFIELKTDHIQSRKKISIMIHKIKESNEYFDELTFMYKYYVEENWIFTKQYKRSERINSTKSSQRI